MYSPIVQMVLCRACPLLQSYPNCTACDNKRRLDEMETIENMQYHRYWLMCTPILEQILLKKGHRS